MLISYVDPCMSRESRQIALKRSNIICECELCNGPKDEFEMRCAQIETIMTKIQSLPQGVDIRKQIQLYHEVAALQVKEDCLKWEAVLTYVISSVRVNCEC
jgi:hypothetical protein